MVSSMKTTIDLPDELAAEAKELARAEGTTLRELVVDGLRFEIERRRAHETTRSRSTSRRSRATVWCR